MKYRRLSRKTLAVGTKFTWKDREGDFMLPHEVVECQGALYCRIWAKYTDGQWRIKPNTNLYDLASILSNPRVGQLYLVTEMS